MSETSGKCLISFLKTERFKTQISTKFLCVKCNWRIRIGGKKSHNSVFRHIIRPLSHIILQKWHAVYTFALAHPHVCDLDRVYVRSFNQFLWWKPWKNKGKFCFDKRLEINESVMHSWFLILSIWPCSWTATQTTPTHLWLLAINDVNL